MENLNGSGETHGTIRVKINDNFSEVVTDLSNKAETSAISNIDNTSDINKPVSTAQQTALDLKLDSSGHILTDENFTTTKSNKLDDLGRDIGIPISGVAYTVVLSDKGKYILCNNTIEQIITIPPNSSVSFDLGTEIEFEMNGTGTVTFNEGIGVTINSFENSYSIAGRYGTASIKKVDNDIWTLIGVLI